MIKIKPYEQRLLEYTEAVKYKDKIAKQLRDIDFKSDRFKQVFSELRKADAQLVEKRMLLANPKGAGR